MQAEADAVGVDTADHERLLNCLFEQRCGMVGVELEDLDKLANTTTIGPVLTQAVEQAGVDRRPAFTPAADGFGMLKSPWALFKQRQIVQRVEHILLAPIAAGMFSKHLLV